MPPRQTLSNDLKAGKNLDAYIAILLGVILAVLAIIGTVKFEFIAAAILLVICFGVWTSLENRHEISDLKETVETLNWSNSILRFADFPDNRIRDHLRCAQEIDVSGLSLFRFMPMYFPDIEESLKAGAALRLIVTDPSSEAVAMAAYRSDSNLSVPEEEQRITSTLTFLRKQISKNPEYKISIKVCPYLTPYSIVVVKPQDSAKKTYCHARLLPFRTSSMRAPTLMPDSQTDSTWITFFVDQFSLLWQASRDAILQSGVTPHFLGWRSFCSSTVYTLDERGCGLIFVSRWGCPLG